MDFAGALPMDAPDPAIAAEARLSVVPFPVYELRPQPSIARHPITGFAETTGPAGVEALAVLFSYTLWRFPDDHADPRNEVELDEQTRRAVEEEPPWGRPAWLVEQVGLLRYPMLWEATRTAWHAAPDHEWRSLTRQLVDHANHVLRNNLGEQLGLPEGPTRQHDWVLRPNAVAASSVEVDGEHRPAAHIDTDPLVYAVGFQVNDDVVCTTVLPRDALPHLDLALTTVGDDRRRRSASAPET